MFAGPFILEPGVHGQLPALQELGTARRPVSNQRRHEGGTLLNVIDEALGERSVVGQVQELAGPLNLGYWAKATLGDELGWVHSFGQLRENCPDVIQAAAAIGVADQFERRGLWRRDLHLASRLIAPQSRDSIYIPGRST